MTPITPEQIAEWLADVREFDLAEGYFRSGSPHADRDYAHAITDLIDSLTASLAEKNRRIAELEAALEPFAECAALFSDPDLCRNISDKCPVFVGVNPDFEGDKPLFKVGDLRCLHALIEKEKSP
jgi:hypothetical protein